MTAQPINSQAQSTDGQAILAAIEALKTHMDQNLEQLRSEMKELSKLTNKLNSSVGDLTEHQCRKFIERVHGGSFAKERTFRTLEDLARFVLFAERSTDVRSSKVLEGARQLARWLMTEQMAHKYLRALYTALEHGKQSADKDLRKLGLLVTAPWFEDNTLLKQNVKQFMSMLTADKLSPTEETSATDDRKQHTPLRTQLGWLLALEEMPEAPAVEYLLAHECQGGTLGMVLAQFAAALQAAGQQDTVQSETEQGQLQPPSQLYLPPRPKSYSDLKLASDSVQCDAQGTIQLYKEKAVVSVGEVKRSAEGYSKGVDQLCKRLALLEWAIRVLFPEVKDITTYGKLFIPKSAANNDKGPYVAPGLHIDVEHAA